jgi:hypothetical protein
MSTIHPTWIEHPRQRWLRPDWQRWVRHDAHRFAPPSVQTKSFAARRIEQRQAEEQAAFDSELSAFQTEHLALRREVAEVKFELAWRWLCRKYGYNPNQPRVPRGNPDGGRWVSGEASGSADGSGNTSEISSDLASDNQGKPGARYAQNLPRGRGPILINGQLIQPTLRQEALLDALEGRSQAATQKVQTVLPNWRAPESVYSTIDGRIESLRAQAESAEAKVLEMQDKGLLPGRYAGESIPARGPDRNYNSQERSDNKRNFEATGCNTCGTRTAGTPSGEPVLDHHPPSAITAPGTPQRLYPQCLTCSLMQGGYVRALTRQK